MYLRTQPHLSRHDDELFHYGIKNMKWGTRRFQDENGHLTTAGLQRFYSARKKRNRLKTISMSPSASGLVSQLMKKNENDTRSGSLKNKKKNKKSSIYDSAAEAMKTETEKLQNDSAENEHYESIMRARLNDDPSKKEAYFQKAVDNYINSHLSSYDGNRAKIEQKMRNGLIGNADSAVLRMWMNDNKNHYAVLGYRNTLGKKRDAELGYKRKILESSYNVARKLKKSSSINDIYRMIDKIAKNKHFKYDDVPLSDTKGKRKKKKKV